MSNPLPHQSPESWVTYQQHKHTTVSKKGLFIFNQTLAAINSQGV